MATALSDLDQRAAAVKVEIERLIDFEKPPRYAASFNLLINSTYTKGFTSPRRSTADEVIADMISLLEHFEQEGTDEDTMNIFSTDLFTYITAEMIEHAGRVTLTVTNVTLEELESARGKETKPVVHFKERDKTWVLNKTNAKDLAAVLGPETDNWRGAKVVLTTERINAFGKYLPVIRVANVTPAQAVKKQAPAKDGPLYGDGSEVEGAVINEYMAYIESEGKPPQTIHELVDWLHDLQDDDQPAEQPALITDAGPNPYNVD